MDKTVAVEVWGEYACFTRPEFRAERVSYEVITPSAARGILNAIYRHPDFVWQIHEIRVHSELKLFPLFRNELRDFSSRTWEPIFIESKRTQRHTLCLRDVDYTIVASPLLCDDSKIDYVRTLDVIKRRLANGKCYYKPALGQREFDCHFAPGDLSKPTVDWTQDLGMMFWGLSFSKDNGLDRPYFFHAELKSGIMQVPSKSEIMESYCDTAETV